MSLWRLYRLHRRYSHPIQYDGAEYFSLYCVESRGPWPRQASCVRIGTAWPTVHFAQSGVYDDGYDAGPAGQRARMEK